MREEIIYCMDLTVYDTGIKTLRYATKGGTYGGNYYDGRVLQPGNYKAALFADGKTYGASQIGFGEVRLNNSDGVLDPLLDYGFTGRSIVFYKYTVAAGLVRLNNRLMEQPVFTLDEIGIRIKDPQARLNIPIQPTKYAGTNSLPNGLEGTDDIKGKPKPLLFGTVKNITPVLVNTARLIYQVSTLLATISMVRDKGGDLIMGADYVSQADMEANPPLIGYFRTWPTATGTYFRLGTSAFGAVTVDATTGAAQANRTAAQLAKAILTRTPPAITPWAADITILDSANGAEMGIYISNEMMISDALDLVLGSVGAWYTFDYNDVFRLAQFTLPTAMEDVTLTQNNILSMKRVASNDPGRGVPISRVNMGYDKNFTVQTDVAGKLNTPLWESALLPASLNGTDFAKVSAYGNEVFVMIANNLAGGTNKAAVSSDGETWIEVTLPATTTWNTITFANGQFVIAAMNTANAATSPDGINWTLRALGFSFTWSSLSYGAGLYVLTAVNNASILVSSDGITWTQRATPVIFYNCIWTGTQFVASGSPGACYTSPTAVTWTNHSLATSPVGSRHFCVGNGVIVALANTGEVSTSTTGITWVARGSLPFDEPTTFLTIAYGDGMFMVTGYDVAFVVSYAAYSPDGITWTRLELPVAGRFAGISYGNGAFVVGDRDSAYAATYRVRLGTAKAAWLSKEYRTVSNADATVLTKHLLAPEMNISTLLTVMAAANAECNRILTLYKTRRDILEVEVKSSVLQWLDLGRIAKIVHARYSYSGGKKFRVIGIYVDWESGITTLTLWG